MQRKKLSFADFRDHPDQFLLDKLVRSDRFIAELLALLGVAKGGFVAGERCTDRSPSDAVASLVETGEWTAQASNARQNAFGRDLAIYKGQSRGDRSPERLLAVNFPGFETASSLFDQEA